MPLMGKLGVVNGVLANGSKTLGTAIVVGHVLRLWIRPIIEGRLVAGNRRRAFAKMGPLLMCRKNQMQCQRLDDTPKILVAAVNALWLGLSQNLTVGLDMCH